MVLAPLLPKTNWFNLTVVNGFQSRLIQGFQQDLTLFISRDIVRNAGGDVEDVKLAAIALELPKAIGSNVTIDGTVKQSAPAKIRVLVKRILKQFGYPPDLTESANALVLEQAELLAAEWAGV